MSDIQVQPPDGAGRPEPAPETVAFGDADGGGLAARLWDHPRLRALRDRPPPGLVAAVSALIAGAAVAVYMDRPVEVVDTAPSLSRAILEPESWLNVQVNDVRPPEPPGEELDRLLAQHPPEATVTVPLVRYQDQLLGLPPGTYHVQVSCSAETADRTNLEGPVWYLVEILDPETYQPLPQSPVEQDERLTCDGELHTISAGMAVTGYQAFSLYPYSAFDELEDGGGGERLFVVASFTPVS